MKMSVLDSVMMMVDVRMEPAGVPGSPQSQRDQDESHRSIEPVICTSRNREADEEKNGADDDDRGAVTHGPAESESSSGQWSGLSYGKRCDRSHMIGL